MDTFAERLSHALTYRDMSMAALARRVGLKPQAIQYLCKQGQGSRKSSEMAAALRVSIDWLTAGKGPMLRETGARARAADAPLDAAVLTHILDAIDEQRAAHGYDPIADRLPNAELAKRLSTLYRDMIAGRREDDHARALGLLSRQVESSSDTRNNGDMWETDNERGNS